MMMMMMHDDGWWVDGVSAKLGRCQERDGAQKRKS